MTEHASKGALKLLLKLAVAPGAREARTNTLVFGAGWLLTTVIFVKATLPVLWTLPPYTGTPPGATLVVGQSRVTVRLGLVNSAQLAEATAVTSAPAQASLPETLTDRVREQALGGAVKLAVKLVKAPGAKLATIKIALNWLLTTTLVSVTLPGLLTLPA